MAEARYSFGPFVLEPDASELTQSGQPVQLGQRALALLNILLDADGRAVSKDALLTGAWPGVIVEEVNLSVQIAALRKVLGPNPDGHDWIATVPRFGYRLPRPVVHSPERPRLPILAVLPFQNLGGDAAQDYFADGMVDDLIAALSRFRSFAVIGRGPSFARKGVSGDPQEVAAGLGVCFLLQGSVRRSGNRLRLVAQLLDGIDGAALWVETFEGPVEEVFDFQDSITRSVAAVVEPQIQRAELEHAQRERPNSIAAYDLYLRAVAQMYAHTPEANADAFRLLNQALAIEPENGVFLAYSSWALEYRSVVGWPPLGPDDQARCVELAHRAIRVAGDNARVLGNCGLAIQSMGGEFDLGQRIVNRAVALNPNDLALLHVGGTSHLIGGDLEESLKLLHRAIAIQPNHAYESMGIASASYMALGRFADALLCANQAIAINERYVISHWVAAAAYAHLGHAAEARGELAIILQLSPGLTVEHLRSAFYSRDPERGNNMFEGLLRAGLPAA